MKPKQKVIRFVDAFSRQRRGIFHLVCGHNVSVTDQELAANEDVRAMIRDSQSGTEIRMECVYCPDLPPEPAPEDDPVEAFRRASLGIE